MEPIQSWGEFQFFQDLSTNTGAISIRISTEKNENRHAGSIIPASNQFCYLKQELMCHPILWNLQP